MSPQIDVGRNDRFLVLCGAPLQEPTLYPTIQRPADHTDGTRHHVDHGNDDPRGSNQQRPTRESQGPLHPTSAPARPATVSNSWTEDSPLPLRQPGWAALSIADKPERASFTWPARTPASPSAKVSSDSVARFRSRCTTSRSPGRSWSCTLVRSPPDARSGRGVTHPDQGSLPHRRAVRGRLCRKAPKALDRSTTRHISGLNLDVPPDRHHRRDDYPLQPGLVRGQESGDEPHRLSTKQTAREAQAG